MARTSEIPAVSGENRANTALVIVGLALAVSAAAILHFFPPENHHFYPRCMLHAWTGLHCPGCGSLRALSALTRGEVAEALNANLLVTLSIPVVMVVIGLRRWWRGDWALVSWIPAWGWWLGLALVLGFGLMRNLPGPPFEWLHP
jgi:hypothetical protein